MKVTVNFEGCQIELKGVFTPAIQPTETQAGEDAFFYLETANGKDIDAFIWQFLKERMNKPKPNRQDHSKVFEELEVLAAKAAQSLRDKIESCIEAQMAEAKRIEAKEKQLRRQLNRH